MGASSASPVYRHSRLATVAGVVGRVLVFLGIVVLLFVAYELWGTGLHEQKAQQELQGEFQQLEAQHPPTADAAVVGDPRSAAHPAPPTAAPPLGALVGQIDIPKLHVKKYVVQGVRTEDLQRGPGHYPDTPLPGEKGNSAIAGHRTTYGAPFQNVDQLRPGDPIIMTTAQGQFTYLVSDTQIVDPSDSHVLDDFGDNRLTLTACHPKYSASQRIIIVAKLVGNPVPTLAPSGPQKVEIGGLASGLGDTGPWMPVLLWGLFALGIVLLTWLVSRLLRGGWARRMLPWLAGVPAFLVVLFVFFENVSQLLPPNF